MDVRELRIGNYLQYFGNVVQVEGIVKTPNGYDIQLSEGDFASINSNSLEPIPLDEDWLGKFGFEKDVVFEDNELFHKNNLSVQAIKIGYDNCVLWYDNEILSNLQHVHTLQNLYFALTGEELTFKNK